MSTMQGFVFLQVSYREVRQQQHFKLCLANIAKNPQQKKQKVVLKRGSRERESAGLECTTKTSDYLSWAQGLNDKVLMDECFVFL